MIILKTLVLLLSINSFATPSSSVSLFKCDMKNLENEVLNLRNAYKVSIEKEMGIKSTGVVSSGKSCSACMPELIGFID